MLLVHPSSTCDVCLDPYNWTSQTRTPHVIACGHVFCYQCLSRTLPVNCPLCRKPYLRERIKKLHVDPFTDDDLPPEYKRMQKLCMALSDDIAPEELTRTMNETRAWLDERNTDSPRSRTSPARNALSVALSGLVRIRLMGQQFDNLKALYESNQSDLRMQINVMEHELRVTTAQNEQVIQQNHDLDVKIKELETQLGAANEQLSRARAELSDYRDQTERTANPPSPRPPPQPNHADHISTHSNANTPTARSVPHPSASAAAAAEGHDAATVRPRTQPTITSTEGAAPPNTGDKLHKRLRDPLMQPGPHATNKVVPPVIVDPRILWNPVDERNQVSQRNSALTPTPQDRAQADDTAQHRQGRDPANPQHGAGPVLRGNRRGNNNANRVHHGYFAQESRGLGLDVPAQQSSSLTIEEASALPEGRALGIGVDIYANDTPRTAAAPIADPHGTRESPTGEWQLPLDTNNSFVPPLAQIPALASPRPSRSGAPSANSSLSDLGLSAPSTRNSVRTQNSVPGMRGIHSSVTDAPPHSRQSNSPASIWGEQAAANRRYIENSVPTVSVTDLNLLNFASVPGSSASSRSDLGSLNLSGFNSYNTYSRAGSSRSRASSVRSGAGSATGRSGHSNETHHTIDRVLSEQDENTEENDSEGSLPDVIGIELTNLPVDYFSGGSSNAVANSVAGSASTLNLGIFNLPPEVQIAPIGRFSVNASETRSSRYSSRADLGIGSSLHTPGEYSSSSRSPSDPVLDQDRRRRTSSQTSSREIRSEDLRDGPSFVRHTAGSNVSLPSQGRPSASRRTTIDVSMSVPSRGFDHLPHSASSSRHTSFSVSDNNISQSETHRDTHRPRHSRHASLSTSEHPAAGSNVGARTGVPIYSVSRSASVSSASASATGTSNSQYAYHTPASSSSGRSGQMSFSERTHESPSQTHDRTQRSRYPSLTARTPAPSTAPVHRASPLPTPHQPSFTPTPVPPAHSSTPIDREQTLSIQPIGRRRKKPTTSSQSEPVDNYPPSALGGSSLLLTMEEPSTSSAANASGEPSSSIVAPAPRSASSRRSTNFFAGILPQLRSSR